MTTIVTNKEKANTYWKCAMPQVLGQALSERAVIWSSGTWCVAGTVIVPVLRWGSEGSQTWLARGHTACNEWSCLRVAFLPRTTLLTFLIRAGHLFREHKLGARYGPWETSQRRGEHFLPAPNEGATQPKVAPRCCSGSNITIPRPSWPALHRSRASHPQILEDSLHAVLEFNCSRFLWKTNTTSPSIPSLAECLSSGPF